MRGNWITANLQAAMEFFNAMMTWLYDLLTINPFTYRGGSVWAVVNTIYTGLLGAAVSLAVILFFMGLMENAGDLIKHKNPGPVIWAFIKLLFLSAILVYGRYFLLLIFSIGKEFIDKIVLKNGVNVFSALTWATVPDNIVNLTGNISMTNGIVLWVVTLFGAIIVMYTCFVIMLTVYGRLFRLYLHIAIAPLAGACVAGKSTMHHFSAFLRSFISVILEGLVIVAACMIFSAFANNFDINNPTGEKDPAEIAVSVLEETEDAMVEGTGDDKAENAEKLWLYVGETMFLFLLMAGVVKGADDYVRKMMGV